MFITLLSFFSFILIQIINNITCTDISVVHTDLDTKVSKIERNNIINKGIWFRNKLDEKLGQKNKIGHFIFLDNSVELDKILPGDFDAFGSNSMQNSPFISNFSPRKKRSDLLTDSGNKNPKTNIIASKKKSATSSKYGNTEVEETNFVNNLKPTSVFHDYPYEVAILLNSNKSPKDSKRREKIKDDKTEREVNENNHSSTAVNRTSNESAPVSIDKDIKTIYNDSTKIVASPKRSMNFDYEPDVIKKIDYTESVQRTQESEGCHENHYNDKNRNDFNKVNSEWHQIAPILDTNPYKLLPKEPLQKSKPVNEKGLIKVISMLTKTFKKIMKQHGEVKDIFAKVNEMNVDLTKNIETMSKKFNEFDTKYSYILTINDKMKDYGNLITKKEEQIEKKEKEMSNRFNEFENQQKQFLQQQQHFFNIQKLMLAQSEKINLKQNLIARTQSEISRRQNNFAKILKKAKQLYLDSRNPESSKLGVSLKIKDGHKYYNPKLMQTSTNSPVSSTSSSVKINLFSIPASSHKIHQQHQNADELILKDKDDQAIDDLVYKYYFNNTFIDNFMKNQILNSFMGNNIENNGRTKTKRNDLRTTLLLPVIEDDDADIFLHKRERRWINHHHKRHNRRRGHKNLQAHIVNANDPKTYRGLPIEVNNTVNIKTKLGPINNKIIKSDPFMTMAMSFCKEIHQNTNQQTLRWCIEKALRRLRYLEAGMMPQTTTLPSTIPKTKYNQPSNHYTPTTTATSQINKLIEKKISTSSMTTTSVHNIIPNVTTTTAVPVSNTTNVSTSPVTSPTTNSTDTRGTSKPASKSSDLNNFPDNVELENNLRQFDIVPDTEGNVYFEGSIHASEVLGDSDSGVDDIMPGYDSNSRVDVDPLTFDIQAKRRAIVKKLNDKIKNSLG